MLLEIDLSMLPYVLSDISICENTLLQFIKCDNRLLVGDCLVDLVTRDKVPEYCLKASPEDCTASD